MADCNKTTLESDEQIRGRVWRVQEMEIQVSGRRLEW